MTSSTVIREDALGEPTDATGLLRPIGILGTGLYVPERVVTNGELTMTLDTSDEWITTRTGIRERRFIDDGLATSDMCFRAGQMALARANITADDLDAIIVTTFTPDQPLPSTALIVKEALRARKAIPLDLTQAACAGGIYSMLTAAHLLQNASFNYVLVIGGDSCSRVTDPTERTTRVFLGDAAGAAVLGPTNAGFGLLAWDTGDELSYEVEIPAGGSRQPTSQATIDARNQFLKMNGRAVWDMAVDKIPRTIAESAKRAGVSVNDVEYFLLHQANLNIINEAMMALGVPKHRAPTTVARFGNTAAASMFTVLHETMDHGVEHGALMILAGIGAGFMWGSLCFRHFGGEG